MNKVVIITGTTASGKSQIALDFARRQENCVIVNCDSMQIYDVLRIITARPSDEELARAGHELYGVVHPSVNGSVAHWLELAQPVLQRCFNEGKLPVLVGGTGMYIKALTEGISNMPDILDEVRARVRSIQNPHEHLRQIDPQVSFEENDHQRVYRAIEIFEQTGKSIAYWQAQPKSKIFSKLKYKIFMPDMGREEIYERINARFDNMIEMGALEEIKALKDLNLDPSLPVMRAHGVPELLKYLDGEMELDAAIDKAKQNTRNYAKRQLTWMRNQFDGIVGVQNAEDVISVIARIW